MAWNRFIFPATLVVFIVGEGVWAQTSSSLRWMLTVDRAELTDIPKEHVLLGPQRSFELGLGLQNFEGPPIVGLSQLIGGIVVDVSLDGESIPVRATANPKTVIAADSVLRQGDVLDVRLTISPQGPPFRSGTYTVTVSLEGGLDAVQFQDGTRWTGMAGRVDTRTLVVKDVLTVEDQIRFHDMEGNYALGRRDYVEAIRHLEAVVQLQPQTWQPRAALGAAYFGARRFSEAAESLERALPGWLRLKERRGDIVTNTLARSYIALGQDADALRVLRMTSPSEREAAERLGRLRSTPIE